MPRIKTQKEIWFPVADIPQNTVFMMGPPCKFFLQDWFKRGLGDKLTKYFTLFKGDFSQMCYMRHEFDSQADFLANKMINNPDWALKFIGKIEDWSTRFFKDSRSLYKLNLAKLNNKQLIAHFNKTLKYHTLSHAMGASVSWHADVDKERVTKVILNMIINQIKDIRLKLSTPEVFTTLSTPQAKSVVEKEEIEFLKLGKQIFNKRKLKQTFIQSDLDWLEKELKNVDQEVYNKIFKHFKKYDWIPYQYKGPAYNLSDFLGRWQALMREGINPQKMLDKLAKDKKKLIHKQKELMTKLKFNTYQKKLIRMSQRLVFLKDYRKMSLYHGMYCYEPFFKEIGKRLGLSLEQVWAMNPWEIKQAVLKNKFNVDELNQRLKECVAYVDRNKSVVWTGEKAKNFLKKIKWEKVKVKGISELGGTCACPGKVKGRVKIINLPQQMSKMKAGDILVAHNTNPNLVPAMKKAGALISEAGGLTCHTAIVARELKTPCLVGVSLATKVFKDGDLVEVDANQGVVSKL